MSSYFVPYIYILVLLYVFQELFLLYVPIFGLLKEQAKGFPLLSGLEVVVLIGRDVSIIYKEHGTLSRITHVIPITTAFVFKKEDLRIVWIS